MRTPLESGHYYLCMALGVDSGEVINYCRLLYCVAEVTQLCDYEY